jgi:hypothetical protein
LAFPIALTMRLLATLAALPTVLVLQAAHLPGGNITYRCLGSNNMHEVTLQLWRDCSGSDMIAQALNFSSSCGVQFALSSVPLVSVQDVSLVCPDQAGNTTCDGGALLGLQLYTYRTNVILSPCTEWTISWNTCCRNPSVNLQLEQGTYIEARLNNLNGACNASPTFPDVRPPFACVDQPTSYDLGVAYSGPHALRYRFINARRAMPDVEAVGYEPPYIGSEPFTGMTIDSLTGQIAFTPTIQGYVVCVVEVMMVNAQGVVVGRVMRDFPFVAVVCDTPAPDASTGTLAATSGNAVASGYGAALCGPGPVCFELAIGSGAQGQAIALESNVGTVLPGATLQVQGTDPVLATICWNSTGAAPGPRSFFIRATNDACPVPGVQTYTYSIQVGAIPPNAGNDATIHLCTGTEVDLTGYVTGSPGGQWADGGPVVSAAGTYTYAVTNGCGTDVAQFAIIPSSPPDAGEDNSISVCADADPFSMLTELLGTPQSGGLWVGPNGLSHQDTFDPASDQAGLYCYTVTTLGNCPPDQACLTIAQLPAEDPQCLGTGLSESSTDMRVAPNPTAGLVRIDGTPSRLEWRDATGRLLWRLDGPVMAGAYVVLPDAWPSGLYLLRTTDARGRSRIHRIDLMR